jgi:SAM-dependent MidA family methyltransferase
MIGLFIVQAWEDRSRPRKFQLVELGPGRGTLMADMLRAAKIRPAFLESVNISLVETSPVLREVQAQTLRGFPVAWRSGLHEVLEEGAFFLVANEFFDALPVHQFVRGPRGWHERMIGADGDVLVFRATPDSVADDFIPPSLRDAPEGSIYETSPASQAIVQDIARRVGDNGTALIIDYGDAKAGIGDTLQAVRENAYADVLAEPGKADLTCHVDFSALVKAASEAGGYVFGPEPQGAFLEALGIKLRAERLKKTNREQTSDIDAAVDRLTNPRHMGMLFKVLAICEDRSPGVPGFSCGS